METVGAGGSTASRLDEQTPTSYEHPKGYFSPESCLGRIVPLEKRRQIESEINEGVKPALSVAKVREVLQGLDLETIGRHVLDIPKSRLEELTDGATTKEQKEVVLIRYWLLHHPLISWRLLIARLDNMGSHDRADQIRHLAEALTDCNLNLRNVLTVLNTADIQMVELCLCTPDDVDEMIWQKSVSDEDRRNQLIKYWLEISPYASWQWLSGRINWKEQENALKATRKYVQRAPDSSLTLKNLAGLLKEVKNLNEVTLWLHIPFTKQCEMRVQSKNGFQLKQAYWEYYLTQHPCPSWHLVAHALYRAGEHRILDQLYEAYIPLDGSLQEIESPQDQSIFYGDEVSVRITTKWRRMLTYQWLKDGELLTANSCYNYFGISSPSLHIKPFLPENVGSYKCIIYDRAGNEAKSRPAHISLGGHVLNSVEMEVLHGLFSDQVNNDLSNRGLSLEIIKSEATNITLEQVKYILRLNGHESIASQLEDELQSSVARNEFLQTALKDGISVALRYLKFLFLGPPRAGKTTFLRRLIGELLNLNLEQQEPSTPMAELHSAVITVDPEGDQLRNQGAIITDSRWLSLKGTEDVNGLSTLDREALMIYRLIKQNETSISGQSVVSSVANTTETIENSQVEPVQQPESTLPYCENPLDKDLEDVNVHPASQQPIVGYPKTTHMLVDHEVEKVFQEWDSLLYQKKYEQVEEIPKMQSILANMIDMGGQPPFLEMLPALTIGPAVYLICFNLLNELDKRYPVKYVSQDGTEYDLQYSYSVLEVLFQSLSSVACLSPTEDEHNKEKHPLLSTIPPSSQSVMVIGTHKDKIEDDSVIRRKDKEIQSHLEKLLTCSILDEQPYHRFLSTKNGRLVVCVDNTAGENEIVKHRNLIKKVIEEKFYDGSRFPIPASWLLFSTFLRKMNKDVLTIEQCQQIAQKLYIPPDHTKHVLWYLHHHIGILMYYKKEDVGEDIVICQPEAVFMSVSELILYSFISKEDRIKNQFWQRGLFRLRDINNVTSNTNRKFGLTTKQLINILQHLNVLVEIHDNVFFIPAVLKAATEDKFLELSSDVAPVMIRFNCVFVPLGCFSSLVAKLVRASKTNSWNLHEAAESFKNLVTFKIESSYFVTLVARLKRYEVHLSVDPLTKHRPIKEVAREVLATVCNMLDSVLEQLRKHYASSPDLTMYRIGFICNYGGCQQHTDDSKSHLMLFDPGVHTVSTSQLIKCLVKDASVKLTDPMYLNWCGDMEKTHQNPVLTTDLPRRDPRLSTKPTIRELQVLKYTAVNGILQRIRIIERASHKWRQIGDVISSNPNIAANLEQQFYNNPQLCLRQLFIDNFMTNEPAGEYSQDWMGIIEILHDVHEEQLAKEVKEAVLRCQDQ